MKLATLRDETRDGTLLVVSKDLKRAAKEKDRLEKEILDLEIKLEELAGQLADPAIYSDYAKVQSLGTEMESVQAQLGEKTDRLGRLGG